MVGHGFGFHTLQGLETSDSWIMLDQRTKWWVAVGFITTPELLANSWLSKNLAR